MVADNYQRITDGLRRLIADNGQLACALDGIDIVHMSLEGECEMLREEVRLLRHIGKECVRGAGGRPAAKEPLAHITTS